MNIKSKNNKTFLYGVSILVLVMSLIAIYGYYEKNRKVQLYKDFRANKKLMCGDVLVQRNRGWVIKNNRFFSNGKTMKTIVFCKSVHSVK
ncbi:hypothetical protein [Sulfurimonas sp.]|uniref:hypothetical protein n=1 Tax=Sulfurimonas sp. TaxID=2022749 RepID=UPI0025E07218|nr:hypothetical protein [Sulfurimonas sp.]